MRKGEYFVITADGQIIIVQQEELNRAQVDGAEDGQTLHLREKENNISLSSCLSVSVPTTATDFPGEAGWKGGGVEGCGQSGGRETICSWLKMSLSVLSLLYLCQRLSLTHFNDIHTDWNNINMSRQIRLPHWLYEEPP